ncbi:EAL domain-containing protein [Synechococcales cyanobacterium C]|uniref:EAL domain-containing protein n=1 Tax=Petrachloros mirabilis ULC683 TaxID=2781853 RepID=A0A8K1ZYL2_9CYAN|nr:EAL domain-containing protein [Petrachloros mirabilis]NCJ06037.1 EAL domain-containing protein [Petrachloros mirabilis ULC683]
MTPHRNFSPGEPLWICRRCSLLEVSGLCGTQLKLEITESVLIENTQLATSLLLEIKQHQIQLCLDDFGTGYSSLSYLHQFPIDVLKIDRSFVAQLEADNDKREIVKAITNLGTTLGLTVVAEGVETAGQATFLQSIGCLGAQGYYFSPPVPEPEVQKFFYRVPSQYSSHS